MYLAMMSLLKVSKDNTFSGSCMVSYLIASINLLIKLELLLISKIIIIGM